MSVEEIVHVGLKDVRILPCHRNCCRIPGQIGEIGGWPILLVISRNETPLLMYPKMVFRQTQTLEKFMLTVPEILSDVDVSISRDTVAT